MDLKDLQLLCIGLRISRSVSSIVGGSRTLISRRLGFRVLIRPLLLLVLDGVDEVENTFDILF